MKTKIYLRLVYINFCIVTLNYMTQNQYDTLAENKDKFEELAANGSVKGLTRAWLKQMGEIHADLFKVTVCVTCSSAVSAAMNRLHRKMKEYESEIGSNGLDEFVKTVSRRRNNANRGGQAAEPKR